MKRSVLFLIAMVSICSVSYAGGPVNTPEPKEVTQEKPKMIAVEFAYDDMYKLNNHFTAGLGIGGNPMLGVVEKDGFGYPKAEYGFTWNLGFGYTWISGQPTEKDIKNALESIKSKFGAQVNEKELPAMVRDELGVNELHYVELGTALLVLPINAEFGTMWILNDNTRTSLGFGFPTLLSFGINFDF